MLCSNLFHFQHGQLFGRNQSLKSLLGIAFELALQNTDQMLEAESLCGCGGLAGAGLGFQFSVSTNTNFVSKDAKTKQVIVGSLGGKLNWEFSGIFFFCHPEIFALT